MTLIVDAAPVVSIAALDHPLARQALEFLGTTRELLVMPAPVAAEIDFLLQRRLHHAANVPFLRDLAAQHFVVECMDATDYATVVTLNEQYRDLNVGLADLSVVVLAARLNTTRIVTFDHRHFRAIRPLQGGAFTLLPADRA